MTMKSHLGRRLLAAALLLGFLAPLAPAGQRPSPPQKREPSPQLPPSPLDDILKQFQTYDGGIQSDAYWKLREFVRARKDDPSARADCEIRLLAFLRSMATPPAKALVCRELRLVAGEKAVSVLQSLLFDASLSDQARYTLERIPGPLADKALLAGLDKATGTMKTGIIASLGARKIDEAVPALAKYLEGSAQEFVRSAALALGQIGGKEAATALAKALPSLRGDFKAAAASALLDCTEDVLRQGDAPAAAAFYDKILASESQPVFLRAATMGKIAASGGKAPELIIETLKTSDPVRHEAAMAKIKDAFTPQAAGPLAGILPSLSEESQIKLLAVLAGYRGEEVLTAIRKAASAESAAVRVAALKAMAGAGQASDIRFLAERAASARGEEQDAARTSLALMKGRAVDEAIVKALEGDTSDDVRGELIAAVGERRMFAAKAALMAQVNSPSERIRIQALKTLRTIGTPSDISALVDLLAKSQSEAEREEVENAAAALARKIAQPENRSNLVKARLAAERLPARRAGLIRILGKIGDDSALPVLRKSLQESDADVVDASVRALSGWPNATPVEDVRDLAKSAGTETQKLLALRGFIRMTALGKYRRTDLAVSDFKLAAELGRRPEEKRLILAALPDFACPEALAFARSLVADPEVKAEAQVAIDRIKKKLGEIK
jgi:HEAT repeat protein